MNKKAFSLALVLLFLLSTMLGAQFITAPVKAELADWKNAGWKYGCRVDLNETAGVARVFEPVDVFVDKIEPGCCTNAKNEIRVIDEDNSDVPCQVYNITMEGEYVKSCNVVFLANCSASSTAVYHIIYNNTAATAPEYDGLRFYTVVAGDTYNITALQAGVEKRYLEIFWMNRINLYTNGTWVTYPPAVWTDIYLHHMCIGTYWLDAWGTVWVGDGKSLSVLNSGPIFVDLNYTEAYGADFYGTVFDHNVSTANLIRVYYQPDLNPLVRYHLTYFIKTNLVNYTISSVNYMDFGFEDIMLGKIYGNFTWKNTAGVVMTVSAEVPTTADMWSPVSPMGWWSFNGSWPGSIEKPAANVGLIPIYHRGTVAEDPWGNPADYTLLFDQELWEGYSHTCRQRFKGTFNGVAGDVIKTSGYIVVNTPVDQNIAPIMEEEATKLRNPLEYSVGPQFEIPEFPFMGVLIILVLLTTTLIFLRKLPIQKKAQVRP